MKVLEQVRGQVIRPMLAQMRELQKVSWVGILVKL